MKTGDLIAILGANLDQEGPLRRPIAGSIGAVAVLGGALVLVSVGLFLGLRPGLFHAGSNFYVFFKLSFASSVAAVALIFLIRAARPGGEQNVHYAVAVLPFAVVALIAAFWLTLMPHGPTESLLMGKTWLECLVAIPLIASGPFALLIWIVRRTSAPTDLVLAGALTGLAAGALSAMGYAVHCINDTVPFVALWYSGTIALCTLAGGLLGPRLLRW